VRATIWRWTKRRASRCSAAELQSVNRPLAAAWHEWSEETAGELAIVHAAADVRPREAGPGGDRASGSSAWRESLSDLLEVHVLAREAGLWSERRGGKASRT
jgi:phosphoenolpyruvate carboxylase